MILWFGLTVMVSIAAVFMSAPFIRLYERRRSTNAGDAAVYRDQLREIDHEASLGLIDNAQADLARNEVKRRILSADEGQDSAQPGLSAGERTFAAIGVTGVVVIGSVALFALTGDFEPAATAPATISQTSKRIDRPNETASRATASIPPNATPIRRAQTGLPPVEELIQRILVRLQRNPNDVEGWRMLGWSYYSTDHFSEAAEAYAKAIELDPKSTEFRDGRAEALIRAANGVVTSEVKSAIERTLEINPKDSRARYIKGLGLEQDGDNAGAQKEWNDLLSELDANDPWAKELEKKIAAETKNARQFAQSSGGVAPKSPETAPAPATAPPSETTAERGPKPEDIRAAEALPPSERAAMIRRMVDSLADKLDRSPGDADGWIKLLRSLSVLGEKDRAKQAFERAMKALADHPSESKRITATAEELGLAR